MERSIATIRPASGPDAPAIARLLGAALGDKYRPAFGGRRAAALTGLVGREIGAPEGGARQFVAELDGALAGTARLTLDDRGAPGVFGALSAELGPARAIWAGLVLSLIGDRALDPGEARVEELAVAGWARRRGLGGALLGACERAAWQAGRERVTLWVAEGNAPARRLYEGRGFRAVRRRRWPLGRLVFGAGGAELMELSPPR